MIWTRSQRNRLLELDAADYSNSEIRDILSEEWDTYLSTDQIRKARTRVREMASYLRTKPVTNPTPYLDKYSIHLKGEEAVPKDYKLLENLLDKPKLKVLVLSDIHVPFTDFEKLQEAIDLNRGADMLVIAGDFLDGYSCMRHRKKQSVPHETELDGGMRVLEYLSELFPWVRIIRGNHDERAIKKIRDLIPEELLYLVENEPLDFLVRPFENVEYVDNWWTQVGDAIIAHQERSSSVEGKPGIYLMEWFLDKDWASRLNLQPRPRVFVTGHTHQISSMYPRDNVKVFESGSMTKPQEYTLDATAFMRTPMNGFVSLTQYHGVTDFNKSREYIL